MLRPKQISTLSQCARSFYLASSRFGTADGASCSSSEDEPYTSRRTPKNKNSLLNETKLSLVSDVVAKGSSPFKDVVRTVSHHPSEGHGYSAPVTHVVPPKSCKQSGSIDDLEVVGGVVSANNVDASTENLACSSKLIVEQLVKTDTAKVGVLPDLVKNGLPASDGGGLLTTHSSMVDTGPTVPNIRSTNRKSSQWANKKGQSSSSSSRRRGSKNYATNSTGSSGRIERSGDHKLKQTVSSAVSGTSVDAGRLQVNTQDGRQAISQSLRNQGDGFIPQKSSSGTTFEENVAASSLESTSHVNKLQHPVNSVKRRGITPSVKSSPNAGRPIEVFLSTLQELKWGTAAEEALGRLPYKLDPFQANQVLKLLQDSSVALGFFNWLKYQPGFKHDEHTYTTMVGILGRARQFGSISRLLEEMVRDGCQPNVVTYNRLIHGYGRANHIKEAMEVFHHMQNEGCDPDHVTFCTLIDIHAKAGYLDDAMHLYQKMLEAGLCPDTFTYSVMINCLGKAGHLPAAHKLFCEMIDKGCVPNLVTYNIMIALQAKARNHTSALKVYHSMRAAGFRPDKITYSIVMEVLGHGGHLDEVEAVFAEMQQDCHPDEPVYGLLVDLWGKAGKVDRARLWYEAMLDAGLRPNVPTCNSLLSAFLRADRFSDAHDVLQNMLEIGLVPSLQTYTLLLSSCAETHGNMGLCCKLMAITGHPAHVFLSNLPAAEPGGQNVRHHTSAFLDLMHSEDRESKRGLMDAVVDFLHKSGLKEEAGSVWEVAYQRNVYPDAVTRKSSAYWLINLHVMSDGTAVIALSRTLALFRRQILESGVRPNRIDIITGWGRRSRVTGSSLVRQAVSDLLHLFRSPFYTESGNSGCFVGSGGPLHSWLLHAYVDRMHLL